MPIKVSGFSLIEVLVSLLILSWLLLGLAVLEVNSMRQARIILLFNLAANQLANLSERVFASVGIETQPTITSWNSENKTILPKGIGDLEGQFPNYQLTIEWGAYVNHCDTTLIGESGCITEKLSVG